MTPTLRRLNDRERYWGLTWPGWAAAAAAGAILYASVKLSPFALKPTVTIATLILASIVVLVLGVSGQALSPGRQLRAIITYRRGPKQWTLTTAPPGSGVVLDTAPDLITGAQPGHTDPDIAGGADPDAVNDGWVS